MVAESSWVGKLLDNSSYENSKVGSDPCGAKLLFAVTDDDSIALLTSVDDLTALEELEYRKVSEEYHTRLHDWR